MVLSVGFVYLFRYPVYLHLPSNILMLGLCGLMTCLLHRTKRSKYLLTFNVAPLKAVQKMKESLSSHGICLNQTSGQHLTEGESIVPTPMLKTRVSVYLSSANSLYSVLMALSPPQTVTVFSFNQSGDSHISLATCSVCAQESRTNELMLIDPRLIFFQAGSIL